MALKRNQLSFRQHCRCQAYRWHALLAKKKSLAALLLPSAVLPLDQPYCPAVSLMHDRFVVQEVDL